jgi:predicted nucleic acid-binding Zn ribbon protein
MQYSPVLKEYCAHGHQVAPGTKLCPTCGSDIEKYGQTRAERQAELQRFDEKAKKERPGAILAGVVLLVVVGLVIAAIVAGGSGEGDPSGDASARLACARFYDLANEADLLTYPEQRERVQGIWGYAEVSETPGIAEAARRMLASITSSDFDSFEGAVQDMDTACSSVEPL